MTMEGSLPVPGFWQTAVVSKFGTLGSSVTEGRQVPIQPGKTGGRIKVVAEWGGSQEPSRDA